MRHQIRAELAATKQRLDAAEEENARLLQALADAKGVIDYFVTGGRIGNKPTNSVMSRISTIIAEEGGGDNNDMPATIAS